MNSRTLPFFNGFNYFDRNFLYRTLYEKPTFQKFILFAFCLIFSAAGSTGTDSAKC